MKQMLNRFLIKYKDCWQDACNVKVRSYLPYPYYQGMYVGNLPPGQRPSDLSRAYAEIELAVGYIYDESFMSPMKQDFMAIYKEFCKRLQPYDRCTFSHVAGPNKVYEHGNAKGIMYNAVGEALCFLDY